MVSQIDFTPKGRRRRSFRFTSPTRIIIIPFPSLFLPPLHLLITLTVVTSLLLSSRIFYGSCWIVGCSDRQ